MREYDRQVIALIIEDVLKAGHAISVNDGEETTLEHSTDPVAIQNAMDTTDEDILYIHVGEQTHFVQLIYGNSPGEVISDYSTSLEALLSRANDHAEKLMD
jgi:hypothetical protein